MLFPTKDFFIFLEYNYYYYYYYTPASAEVKKMWIYTSTPPYAFMVQCLIS
jgi:hypothetical protein